MENKSSTDEMYFLFSVVSSFIRCPHVQYTIPALQCVRHALHCDFGSTLIISHSSVFPAAIIAQIFVCVVTRSTTAEVQHNDMMMWTNVQNDLRYEMALEMWIVSVHEKSEQL